MFKTSICIETVYREAPFLERIGRAARAGVDAVEFWGREDKDLPAIKERAEKEGLSLAAMAAGEELTEPGKKEENVQRLVQAIGTAAELDCANLIVTVGEEREGLSRKKQRASIIDVLKAVAPKAEGEGVTLVLEPLNTAVDHQGYFLSSSFEGYEIVEKVANPNLKLLFDIYHQQITEGNIIANVTAHIDLIGHFHLADVPGRGEPGTGELNYGNIFREIARSGYDRFVGCEFKPKGSSVQAVKAFTDLVRQAT